MYKIRRLLCIGLLLVLASAACRAGSQETKLVYGLTLAPSNIDPHIGASSELGIPLTSVYDPLVWLSPDGEFVPGLAQSWQVSADGKTYTFVLRQDVTFHDGTSFDADAVCFNLERIVDPETKSAKARNLLGPFEDCQAIDSHTVQMAFTASHAPLLSALSQVYIAMASPTAVQKWGDEYQFHQVGTGPFMFEEYIPKDHLTLTRNPDYGWAPDFFSHQGPAYLGQIEFRFYLDPASRSPALESGEVDIMGEIPPVDAARLDDDPSFQLMAVPIPGEPLLMHINTARAPTNDLRVRQALLYAIDKEAIIDTVFMGYSPPAHGPLSRVTWSYDPGLESLYPHDAERARQLLDEAGWIDGDDDGIRDKEGQPLILDTVLTSWGLVPEVGQILQDQYTEIGVQLNIQVIAAYPAVVQAANEGLHHLIPFVISGSDPHILRSSFHSSNADGGLNWSKVRDNELDQLLDRGMQTLDPSERALVYQQIQQRIMQQAWIIPIRDYVNLNAASDNVTGLRYDGQGWFPWLYDVDLE